MPKKRSKAAETRAPLGYREGLGLLEHVLGGDARARILDQALATGNFGEALRRLRAGMRSHTFDLDGEERLRLAGLVQRLDERTRGEGFHVLHEWDGKRFVDETIPVMMVDYYARATKAVRPERWCLAILLDYYFLYVLALFLMRIWDEGDPGENLDRVRRLLDLLQGERGSGFQFLEGADTLLWVAISHYEPDDYAYHRLLEKVRGLDERHRRGISRVGAAVLGDHLRWGFPVYYERDLGLMRADNVSDYPWLLYSVLVLARAYGRMAEDGEHGPERDAVVEALLNGLTPDTRAFTESPPSSLVPFAEEHAELRDLLLRHGRALVEEFERHRPEPGRFTPLGFQFNFPHNALIPMVTLALVQGVDARLNMPLDALLRRDEAEGASQRSPETLARTLMAYAGYSPERRGGRRTLMIIYDPNDALASYRRTVRILEEAAGGASA